MTAKSGIGTNLPTASTSFVGRRMEVAAIDELLSAARVVTLTGPGGIGKSRLALEVAHRLTDRFPGGVWHVELGTPALTPDVGTAIAHAIGTGDREDLDPVARLAGSFGARPVLLVLDELEWVVEPLAELVPRLLAAAPGTRILGTSRLPLRIAAEHLVTVHGLAFDGSIRGGGASTEADAIALFAARARAARSDFELDAATRPLVREIVAKLEGHALAIELAAARLRHLNLADLLRRIDDCDVLDGGPRDAPTRQRSLDATIDWTFELLGPPAQAVFPALSVFRAGFDAPAARAVVANFGGVALDAALGELVDHSLVVAESASTDPTRYRLLEPIRQAAERRLGESAAEGDVHDRHARFYAAMVREAMARDLSSDEVRSLDLVDRDADNARAALDWLIEHEPRAGLRLVVDLARFWMNRGSAVEAAAWIRRALDAAPAEERRGAAWLALAWSEIASGDIDAAGRHADDAVAEARVIGDRRLEAESLLALGTVGLHRDGDPRDILAQASVAAEAAGDTGLAVLILGERADVEFMAGEVERALAYAARALEAARAGGGPSLVFGPATVLARDATFNRDGGGEELWREALGAARALRSPHQIHYALRPIAELAAARGDLVAATSAIREVGAIAEQTGLRYQQVQFVESSAQVLLGAGRPRSGLRLAAAANALKGPDWIESPSWRDYTAARIERARRETGAARHSTEPEVWTLGSAVTEARREIEQLAASASQETGWMRLSEREREVATLAAEGLTNREIAARLGVSERTVEAHIRHILDKLEVSNRTQVAGWVRARESDARVAHARDGVAARAS